MEPIRSTDEFSRRITSTDANNIVIVLDLVAINSEYSTFEQDYVVKFQVALEDLKCTVGLFSLSPAPFPNVTPLMSEAQVQAEIAKIQTEGQKIALGLYTAKGNGPWVYKSRVVLQNHPGDENHVPILVPFLSSNETFLVGGNFRLGVRIEPIWNQPLQAQDYLVISGTYKQVVSFSEKKNDSIAALLRRIETLELALSGRLIDLPPNTLLGRGSSGVGSVEQIPNNFAQLTDIATLTNNLALKAPLESPSFSGPIANTGGQIAFPAVPIPSTNPNTLDDYKEGTWIPSIIGLTSAGSATYSSRIGTFLKIGRLVFCSLFVDWSGHTGTGNMSITGLPYTSSIFAPATVWHSNLSASAGSILQFYIPSGANIIAPRQVPVSGGTEAAVPLDVSASLMISVIYLSSN
jgi:hypothetical protein